MNKLESVDKISILLSVYNQIHCLEKALNSALSQNYPSFEIIVGDDCSVDGNVKDYLDRFDDTRIKYIRNPVNLGANGNYKNMLSNFASGKYAIVLNADDYWIDNNFLSEAVSIFQNDDDVVLVFGGIKTYISSANKFIQDKMHDKLPEIMSGTEYFLDYNKGYSLPHLTCLYHRETALVLDFYNSDMVSTDWEYLLKIIIGNKIGIIQHSVGVLTKHNENYTKENDLEVLKKADSYIHRVFQFALAKKLISKSLLMQWKRKMLIRHHSKWLVKLYYLDASKVAKYKSYLRKEYPEIYSSIVYNIRYLGFLLLSKSPLLMKLAFRYVFRQESFIADLIAYKKAKEKQ